MADRVLARYAWRQNSTASADPQEACALRCRVPPGKFDASDIYQMGVSRLVKRYAEGARDANWWRRHYLLIRQISHGDFERHGKRSDAPAGSLIGLVVKAGS